MFLHFLRFTEKPLRNSYKLENTEIVERRNPLNSLQLSSVYFIV